MRKLITFLIICFISISVFAKPIDKSQAKKIAESFFSQNKTGFIYGKQSVVRENGTLQLVYAAKSSPQKLSTDIPLYYVFNNGENEGFVVVSADTRVKQILGYSDSGSFSVADMPENMRDWFAMYEEEIAYAIENLPEIYTQEEPKRIPAQITETVEPLLGDIKYDQGKPYNDDCPRINGKQTPTGCVATGLAQIMKYHQWPDRGEGSHSYISRKYKIELSANFGEASYDWKKIKTHYNNSSKAEDKAEIAKLMSHIGVAVEMNYKPSGSGTDTFRGVKSLITYFKYAKTMEFLSAFEYADSPGEWENKIKTELQAGRPILYRGVARNAQGRTSGHAFVCDGFNKDGLFHFNWGWSGDANGYYALTALQPRGNAYNFAHQMVIGIQPNVDKPIMNVKNVDYSKIVNIGDDMKIEVLVENKVRYAEKKVECKIYKDDDTFVSLVGKRLVQLYKDETGSVEYVKTKMNLEPGMYYFRIYNDTDKEWLSEDKYSFEVKSTAGIFSTFSNTADLKITPNAVESILRIELPEDAQRMFIYDTQGRVMHQMNVKGKTALQTEVGNFNKGTYIVRVIGKEINYVSKFLKK